MYVLKYVCMYDVNYANKTLRLCMYVCVYSSCFQCFQKYIIKLRNGDSGMEFQCARKLEKQYNARNITVYYVLMTSSSHLQNHYKSLYGDKLILPSWTPLTIVDFHHGG